MTHSDRYLGIGVDTEEINRKNQIETFGHTFSTKSEIELQPSQLLSDREKLLLIFSAKESLFKTLYPLRQEFFGFMDAKLIALHPEPSTLEDRSGRFEIQLTQNTNGFSSGHQFVGRYLISPYRVHTLVWIDAA